MRSLIGSRYNCEMRLLPERERERAELELHMQLAAPRGSANGGEEERKGKSEAN